MKNVSSLKKGILGILFLGLIGLGVIGCKKENIKQHSPLFQNNILKSGTSNIPYFRDFNELDEAIYFLESKTEEERRSYENSNGYSSLLTSVYLIYEGIDTSSISEESEIYSYVNSHNDVLTLFLDDDNEMIYYPYYSENRYSIVANENRLLQVGDMYMKVFDDGIAMTTSDFLSELTTVNSVSVKKMISNNNIIFYSYDDDEVMTKSACGSAKSFVERNTKGKYRTKLKLKAGNEITSFTYSEKTGLRITYRVHSEGYIRGYKKFLGIWFYTKKQITGKIKYQVKYLRGTTETLNVDESINGNSYVQRRYKNEPSSHTSKASDIRFEYIDSWGKIPQTNKAQKVCN